MPGWWVKFALIEKKCKKVKMPKKTKKVKLKKYLNELNK